jgi:hypothetical protein
MAKLRLLVFERGIVIVVGGKRASDMVYHVHRMLPEFEKAAVDAPPPSLTQASRKRGRSDFETGDTHR